MRFLAFFILGSFGLNAAPSFHSSETIDARKGVFRLLSADLLEEESYHFVTSIQYFQDDDIFEDNATQGADGARAKLGIGYALFDWLLLSAQGGFDIATRDLGGTSQNYNLFRISSAATASFDAGQEYFELDPNRFNLGASLWVDFSKITRFFNGPNLKLNLIASSDWSDKDIPFRVHGNAGFQPKNEERYFDADAITQNGNPAVNDFDRFATRTSTSHLISAAAGVEFPFEAITPSLEAHIEYALDADFSSSPKWLSLGAKARPFPQKNIELFVAGDLGLSTYEATPITEKPEIYAVPLWNVVVGFGLSEFGKKPSEIAVDSRQYEALVQRLEEREQTLDRLERDLAYNTLRGRVIDAENKRPLEDVRISFPDFPEWGITETSDVGEFLRYFPHLQGARVVFSKEGFESSSKFYSLKPGESIRVQVELEKDRGLERSRLVMSVVDEQGNPVSANLSLVQEESGEEIQAQTDANGNVNLAVPSGIYNLEINSEGFNPAIDRIELEAGQAVLRNYSLTRQEASPTSGE